MREMCALREKGVDVEIFSIMSPPPTTTMHPQVQTLLPHAHYSAFFLSLKLIFAQIYFLIRSPRRYISALRRLAWQTSHELKSLVMALFLFPKSVYFAWLLKDMQVDHIHAHFVWLNAVAAQVAADLLGLPISLHAHAWDIFRRNPECVRRQIQLATCVITVSEYHRQFLTSLVQNHLLDIRIVHYGLDPNDFIRTNPVPNNQTVQIISVGRLVEKKGFEYLIEACKMLGDRGIPYRCRIVGEGPDQRINAMIRETSQDGSISMDGAKNITDIIAYYQMSDIFVLPCVVAKSGDRDGMPNVLLEAMAMQLPVITTPVTGNTELIQDRLNGLLVPERDPNALADAIQRLIGDPGLRMRLGAAGRQTILTGFDIHSTAVLLLETFNTLQKSVRSSS